jgi:hypothetical protein
MHYMVISNRYPGGFGTGWSFPPYLPDLSPSHYFLWGFLKDNIWRNNPHLVEEWKGEIMAAVESITEETLAAVMENFS